MSLIRLLTATEKQVHLGQLHMRPIQWYLKKNCRVPESPQKVIPVPRSLHPYLRWWRKDGGGKMCLQILTDTSQEGWGAHLNEATYNLFGAKGGFPGPKRVPRPLFEQHSYGSHRQH